VGLGEWDPNISPLLVSSLRLEGEEAFSVAVDSSFVVQIHRVFHARRVVSFGSIGLR